MERISFWISSERRRGSKSFKACTSCGANLFNSDTESLEFYGTHPLRVLCLSCKEALDRRSRPWAVSFSVRKLASAAMEVDRSRPTSVGLTVMASLVAASFILASAAVRLASSSVEAGPFEEVRDLVLVFVPYDPHDEQVTSDYLAPYVSYLGEDGTSREWLFDCFLFLSIYSQSKACFRGFSTASDWRWWIDKLFADKEQIDALNNEVERVKKALGNPSKRGVVISIPYPDPSVKDFGLRSKSGRKLSFSATKGSDGPNNLDRLEACTWFVEEVVQNWETRARRYNNLELVGFYWFQEELREGDDELLKLLAEAIHSRGFRFFWIPYNSEANIRAVESYHRGDLPFDYVWIQPNWAFPRLAGQERWERQRDLDSIAEVALELGASIEVEMDQGLYERGDLQCLHYFYDYLDGGLTHLYMGRPLSYYVFPNDLYRSPNPVVRRSYDALCEFVRERYRPASYILHCDVGANDTSSRFSSIFLESLFDWGPPEIVDGSWTRLAHPGACFVVSELDPFKDFVVAVRYQSYSGGEVQARIGDEWKSLGTLEADGKWHTAHWKVDLSGMGMKRLVARVSNLTRVSDIWAYPDETIFRLSAVRSAERTAGLFSDAAFANGSSKLDAGGEVVFAEVGMGQAWLVGISYRAANPVGIEMAGEDYLQTVSLPQSSNWTKKVFFTEGGSGGGQMRFKFDREIELAEMWASPPKLHTDVGTSWDTSLQRHKPGASLGPDWGVSRTTSTHPTVTYRTGKGGSTIQVDPFDSSRATLLTLLYRSEAPVEVVSDAAVRPGSIPAAGEWSLYALSIPPSSDLVTLQLSGQIDLASMWLELA